MNKVTAFMGFIFLVVSSAWAQTPPATPSPPPAGDAGAAGGGIMDYWWVILLIIIVSCSDLVLLAAWQERVGMCRYRNGSRASSVDQKPF